MSLPQLNKSIISEKKYHETPELKVPDDKLPRLPEKVLQFGSGALLRGFTDFFIDQANRSGIFNGRVVIVNSTRSGRSNLFNEQEGLFTLCVEGFAKGETVREYIINAAVSRAISAADHWPEVLRCAHNPELSVITSNTTEVGITLKEDEDLSASPPASFPGKLAAFLYERFRAFNGNADKGVVVLPTELILDNGQKLKEIVLALAEKNKLPADFVQWLQQANTFCNTLVDRIVPGTPDEAKQKEISETLGYHDELLTVSEVYRLFAIEGPSSLREKIPFVQADDSIIIDEDITPYRERKLRILNGGHTISVAAGFLCGLETVYDCMQSELMSAFINRVMLNEIVPSLDINQEMAKSFAEDVQDRFRNPFLNHKLISITLQYSSKMNMRNGKTFVRYASKFGKPPEIMCAGFAAYLLFTRPVQVKDGKYFGEHNGTYYPINDDAAEYFMHAWAKVNLGEDDDINHFVREVLFQSGLWDQELTEINGFADAVSNCLIQYIRLGVYPTLHDLLFR